MPYPKYKLPSWYKPNYSYMEDQIAKLDRRIKRIIEKPDPSKLAANRIMYECEREGLIDRLEAWKAGEPFVYPHGGQFAQMLGLRTIESHGQADRHAAIASEFFSLSRGSGYYENSCDRAQVFHGLMRAGALPPPSFVYIGVDPCDVVQQTQVALLHDFPGCPSYMDDHLFDRQGEQLDYFVKEMRELAAALKEAIPETKELTDELILKHFKTAETLRYHTRVLHLAAKQIPCAVRGQEIFRLGGPDLERFPQAIRYYEERSAELMKKIENGFSAIKAYTGEEEKARCMWIETGPYFEDLMAYFERRGVAVCAYETGSQDTIYGPDDTGKMWDTTHFGRELSPLEEYCRQAGRHSNCGPAADNMVAQFLKHMPENHIDMMCFYNLSGCPRLVHAGRIAADLAERELGVPTLFIDGYEMDQERYDAEGIHAKVDEFIDMVFERKGIKGIKRKVSA